MTTPSPILHMCMMCKNSIPMYQEHLRMTIELLGSPPDVRRYCARCMEDPMLAVVGSHVLHNPVKRIEMFMCYR